MPNYLVLTHDNRNLVIKADGFSVDRDSGTYQFINKKDGGPGTLVAAADQHVLAVIEQGNAFIDDFYDGEDSPNDDTDDVCLDCRFEEFLESEEFFDAVAEIVDGILEYRQEQANVAPGGTTVQPYVELRYIKTDGHKEWGFLTPEGWVGYTNDSDDFKGWAESGVLEYQRGDRNWIYTPVEETEVIQ